MKGREWGPLRWIVVGAVLLWSAVGPLQIVFTQLVTPHRTYDFFVYFHAAQAVARGASPYAPPPSCCFNQAAMSGYTYPPLLAILLVPLTALSADDAARIWLVFVCFSLVTMVVVARRAAPGRISAEAMAWLTVLILHSGGVLGALREAQATVPVLALVALFAWSYVHGRRSVVGGALLAVAAAIKVWPLLLVPALLRLAHRERVRSAIGFAGAGVAALALMIGISGQLVPYITHVLPSFSGGVVSADDLSIPGSALRSFATLGARPNPVLMLFFSGLEVVALGITWYLCRGVGGSAGRAILAAALMAIIPIVQGVTWNHHVIVDVIALMLVLPLLRRGSLCWSLAIAGCAVATVWQQQLGDWLTGHGWLPPHNSAQLLVFLVVTNIDLIGMFSLWFAIVLLARHMREAAPGGTELIGRRSLPLERVLRPGSV